MNLDLYRASNWDFERKKRDYFQSRDGRNPYPITQEEVLDAETWTPAHLEALQLRLLGVLAEVWHLKRSLNLLQAHRDV